VRHFVVQVADEAEGPQPRLRDLSLQPVHEAATLPSRHREEILLLISLLLLLRAGQAGFLLRQILLLFLLLILLLRS
jgi:hypothetical protein